MLIEVLNANGTVNDIFAVAQIRSVDTLNSGASTRVEFPGGNKTFTVPYEDFINGLKTGKNGKGLIFCSLQQTTNS